MLKNILLEGLQYLDMQDMVVPSLGIDLFESGVGGNDDIITLSFTVKQKPVAKDLSEWFERGYDWVIDSEYSPGEVADKEYLVFVEMPRRYKAPSRIIELVSDMETLTGLKFEDWEVETIDGIFPLTERNIRRHVLTSPKEYRDEHKQEEFDSMLNEWINIAGVKKSKNKSSDDL
jgi:hypothetical protein